MAQGSLTLSVFPIFYYYDDYIYLLNYALMHYITFFIINSLVLKLGGEMALLRWQNAKQNKIFSKINPIKPQVSFLPTHKHSKPLLFPLLLICAARPSRPVSPTAPSRASKAGRPSGAGRAGKPSRWPFLYPGPSRSRGWATRQQDVPAACHRASHRQLDWLGMQKCPPVVTFL